jgi:hypothetical protein
VKTATTNDFQIEQKPRFTITAITQASEASVTAAGNNLAVGDYVQFAGVTGMTEINGLTGIVLTAGNTFTVNIDTSGFTAYAASGTAENLNALFQDVVLAGGSTYIGEGEIKRVPNFSIRSKKFNILNQGKKTQLGYIDFLIDKTDVGEVSVPVYVDYNNTQRVNPRNGDPFFNWGIQTTQLPSFASTDNEDKVWHRMYCPVEGQFFQYEITLDAPQLISKQIYRSDFQLNALIVWHEMGGRLVR